MTNNEIAQIFEDLALILEYLGENPFKVNAYKNAYKVIITLNEPLEQLYQEGRLEQMKGIGKIIKGKITEIIETGKLQKHEVALNQISAETLDILRNVNVAPRVIRKLVNFWGESPFWEKIQKI